MRSRDKHFIYKKLHFLSLNIGVDGGDNINSFICNCADGTICARFQAWKTCGIVDVKGLLITHHNHFMDTYLS